MPDVSGEWEVREVSPYGDRTLTYTLAQDGEHVTYVVPPGIIGFEGIYRNGLLRMSWFDGFRTLLLPARATPDGRLEGTFWVADQSGWQWSARRVDSQQ